MARTVTADTFERWWAALDERARQEEGAKEWSTGAGLRLSAAHALKALEACASPFSLDHDGIDSDGQVIQRVIAESDTIVLERSGNGGDEFVEDLIKNFIVLTGLDPEYVDEPVRGNDVEPMVERLREARDARDQ